ncbi:hypothetical protein [Streptomyces misionensis]
MTAVQLTLGDLDPRWRDLRHQGLTAAQYARIVDVQVVGDYL